MRRTKTTNGFRHSWFQAALAVTLMAGAPVARAADYTWLVTGSNLLGYWSNAASWNPTGVPTAGDTVTVTQDLVGTGTIQYFAPSGTVATSGTQQIDTISATDTATTGSLRFSAGGTTAYLQFATATPSVTANVGGSGSNITVDNPLFQPSSTFTKGGAGIVQFVFNDAKTADSFSTNVSSLTSSGAGSLALWNLSGTSLNVPNVQFASFVTGLTIRAGTNRVVAGNSIDLGTGGALGVGSGGTLTFEPGSTLNAGNLITTTGNSGFLYMGGDSTVNWSGDNGTLTTLRMGEQALYGSRTSTVNVSAGTLSLTAAPNQSWLGNPSAEANQVRTYTLNLNVNGGLMQFTSTDTVERNFVIGWNRLNTTQVGTGVSTVNATVTISSGTLDMGTSGRIILGDRLPTSGTAAGFVNSRINLDGGVLRVAQNIARGNSNTTNGGMTSSFYFNGGLLQLGGTPALRLINSNVDTYVSAGGAIIDTNGFSTNIASSLVETATSAGGGLTKRGNGTLSLAGTNRYTGPTVVEAGTLTIGGTNELNGSGGVLGSGSYANTITVAAGAGLGFTAGTGEQILSGNIAGTGATLTKINGSGLTLTGTSVEVGSAAFNGGQTVIDPGTGGTFRAPGRFQMATLSSSGSASLDILSGDNQLGTSSGIAGVGDGPGISALAIRGGSTTLVADTNRVLIGNKGAAYVTVAGGNLTITGSQAVYIGGDQQFALDNAYGSVTVSSGTFSITDPGTLLMGVNVSGETLTNTSNATGVITLDGGVFATARPLVAATGTNPGTAIVNFNGGTLRALTSSTDFIAVTAANVQDGGAIFDTAGNDVTVRQALLAVGAGGLTKLGAGTLRLDGANAYTGPTAVNVGTLRVEGDQSAATGEVTVASGATLAGTGTVGGATTIQSGATLSPGASPGTLTFTQALTMSGGGNYNWQVYDAAGTAGSATGWDLVSVGGALSIASTSADKFNINLWSLSGVGPDTDGEALNFSATTSGTWRIATATGGITGFAADKFRINVSATNGTGGFTNALSGGTFSLAQSGNDLNLVFTAGGVGPTAVIINVPTGTTQTQAQAGYPSLTPLVATSVTKTGGGTVIFDTANTYTGTTSVNQGTLRVTNSGALQSTPIVVQTGGILALPTTSRLVLTSTSLNVDQATGGVLDIGKGRINIAPGGTTETALRADLISGRSGGSWSGTSGIITTGGTAGLSTQPVVGYRVFTTGSAIVAWAAFGDANLDGQVNLTDVSLINNGGKFGQGASTNSTWVQGDFNYSGGVTLTDISLLNNSGLYNAGSYLPVAGLGSLGGLPVVASVPEPGTWALAVAGLAALAAVRGRSRSRPRR